ncbi:putative peptide modification system cyclase [uncultured Xanthomonas sp.]|uniref:putative peptide modification system cyclase n=1 Tax=uncultured Xanthomonas sp. TaxID=152831 RepID=UPI0025EED464|nr:putative peptide modification system cyclase [uncultured Xanthomonas sp.]
MTDAIAPPPEVPQLRTLLLTDLCDSVALVEKLGDANAAELFKRHDSLVLELQQRWRGRLIDRSDGLLLLFERPIDGLGFALDYSRGLHTLGTSRALDLKVRAGLHVGEVLTWRNSDAAVQVGAKPLEVEGLAKPTAARLMTLARPGQILLSAVAESLTHRAARELGERGERLLWKSHGRWRFKGVPTPLEIYEVGEIGHTPLRAPKPTPKAWRDIPLWRRPAALAAEAALIAAFAVGAWFVTRPQPAIAFAERDWVVVGDLRNLTGDVALDDSLQQAFRISLEQSRYVNVLSDLKVRETLGGMRRDPESTVLNRETASEVALRSGARAVILPTVSEFGGRLRISAEVVDPRTQSTVYAQVADGRGMGSALASVDTITHELRQNLGEALANVEKESIPLPQVATANLDALRAYALGVDAYGRSKRDQALALYRRAVELDPEFALAYLGILRVYVSASDNANAEKYLRLAMKLRDRLPPRDRLYLDAWSAEFSDKPAMNSPERWKTLADIYPDYYAGTANYAWSAFVAGDYEGAYKTAQRAAVQQNPLRGFAIDTMARARLAENNYASALELFRESEASRGLSATRQRAATLAAMGRLDDAETLLKSLAKQDALSEATQSAGFETISIAVDRRKWRDARRTAATYADHFKSRNEQVYQQFLFMRHCVDFLTTGALKTSELEAGYAQAVAAAARANPADRSDLAFIALGYAYLAQRSGNATFYTERASQMDAVAHATGDSNVSQLLAILKAGDLRLKGNCAGSIGSLNELLSGREIFQAHVALRDAAQACRESGLVARQDAWLEKNRGLAYIQAAGSIVMQPLNVSDTRPRQGDRVALN